MGVPESYMVTETAAAPSVYPTGMFAKISSPAAPDVQVCPVEHMYYYIVLLAWDKTTLHESTF